MKTCLGCLFVFFGVLVIILLMYFYHYRTTPLTWSPSAVTLTVPPGSSLKEAAHILGHHNLIDRPLLFLLLARLKKAEHQIKSGEYTFFGPVAPEDILDKMLKGEVNSHPITFPEGSTLFDVARIIQEAGFGPSSVVLATCRDAEFIKTLGISAETLEGYLFPDTYRFSRDTSPAAILKKMVCRFKDIASRKLTTRAMKTGLSAQELIVLASLVQKEAARSFEMPLIAGVFFNRLKRGMKLECDPTVIYGLKLENPDFNRRLRKRHLLKRTPYNTYQMRGLPPGPICNPGLEAIQAVLNPARVDYLYFVSKNNGTHKFSKSLREHNRAVNKYQRGK